MGDYDALMAAPLPAAAGSPTPAPAAAGGDYSALMAAPVPNAEPPSILESVGRGALQGASFGFADEIAGALGAAFTPKTYRQARDESRAAYAAAKEANPKAYVAGEIGGGLASAVIPGGVLGKAAEGGAAAVEAAPTIGRLALKGAATGAAYGGAQALGDSTADLTQGDFHGAIADTLRGAAIGGLTGAIIHPAATKLLEGAPERQAQNILDEIAQGEGKAGSATTTAKKLLARDKEDIVRTIQEDPVLAKAIAKPAKEALPVINETLDRVGSALDPNYQVVTKATGGVSLSSLVRTLDQKAAEYAKSPLNEQYVNAIEDIRNSALKAWAPRLHGALQTEEAQAVPAIRDAILDRLDTKVPEQDLRKMVTRLQTRGSQAINPLNPGEATIMKADMAQLLKGVLDEHLDAAAAAAPDVATAVNNIRQINSTYSALANIQKAIEQRGWKEMTGSTSLGGHLGKLADLGGLGAAALGLAHGGSLPGAIATAALAHYAPGAARTLTHEGNRVLADIAAKAAAGQPTAELVAHAIKVGVPRAVILRVISGITKALSGNQEATP